MASSSRAFDSADIDGRTRVECEPGLVGFVWADAVERPNRRRRSFTQRPKGTEEDAEKTLCVFFIVLASLREIFFMNYRCRQIALRFSMNAFTPSFAS